MDTELYQNGEVVGTYTIPKEILNLLCESLTQQGHRIDWHYFGGRAVVKTCNKSRVANFQKVFGIFQLMTDRYEDIEISKL